MLLGIDIGGTKCAVILAERKGPHQVLLIEKEVIPTDRPPLSMIESIFTLAEKMLDRNGIGKEAVKGIGISCGGPLNSKSGLILSPPNLPGWDHIPIVQLTVERFGITTTLQNDANACAMAEWKFGAGRGFRNVIFLTFGTGMGAGLILDGRLYSGTSDLAGEVGHMRLAEMGPVGFGKAGSFEGYCSGGGIAQLAAIMVRAKLQMGEKVSFCSSMAELPSLTAKLVAEAAFAGDDLAIEIYRTCGRFLGKGLSILIDLLNPEIIILGSIFGRAQSLVETDMKEVIRQETLADSKAVCRIVPAELGEHIGDMAALTLAEMSSVNRSNV